MKEKQKKLIFIVVGLIIAIILVLLLVKSRGEKEKQKPENDITNNNSQVNDVSNEKYTEVLESGTKINNSKEFNKPKKYKDLEITNIQYTLVNGNSVLLADVKNLGNKTYEQQDLNIILYDENDEEIIKTVIIVDKIKPGEIKQINTILTADILNVKDFKIEDK